MKGSNPFSKFALLHNIAKGFKKSFHGFGSSHVLFSGINLGVNLDRRNQAMKKHFLQELFHKRLTLVMTGTQSKL